MSIFPVPRSRRGMISHCRVEYGRSGFGAPLELFLPHSKKFKTLVMAGQHGSEPDTTILLSDALRTLPARFLRCGVILAANPDGLARGTRCNAVGVDLNRNFPASNWTKNKVFHRWYDGSPSDTELSPGSSPASEPETKALLNLIVRNKITMVISLHSALACIDDPLLSETGKRLSKKMKLPLKKEIGYVTPGSLGSWAQENNVHLITVELPHGDMEKLRKRYSKVLCEILCDLF